MAFCRTNGFKPEFAWTCHDYAAAVLDDGTGQERAKSAALPDEGEHTALMNGASVMSLLGLPLASSCRISNSRVVCLST
jgi:hypothetical protein